MSERTYSSPSVRQLAAVADRVTGSVSVERARQLRMVVGMWDRAVGREEMPGRAYRNAGQLFTWAALDAFWDLAEAGELWQQEDQAGKPMPLATRRIVRDCLEILAREVVPDRRVRLPTVVQPAPRATTTRGQEVELFRFLVGLASGGPLGRGDAGMSVEYRARLLALTGVALDTRSRSGELAAMRMSDLGEGEATVRVRRRQQNGKHLPQVELVLPLSEGTRVAVRRWLTFRDKLVYPLQGSADALWVTLVRRSASEPAGVPLAPDGLRRAYARGVATLNWVMAGTEGWEPLPGRLEGLRRAFVVPEEVRAREERAELAEALRPRRPLGRPRLPADRPLRHGREACYNAGCRKAECREAATNGRQARREEARLRSR
ncbi:hypothetical protein AB0D12_31545 [Streptomyces sp. NPDC048479]|uniref:hypothetical protein n=1 Tax=Streptomyces sp. NPDC048479 TaxID=3154725 RepID=UPI0034485D7C